MPKGQRLVKSQKPKPTRDQILAMYDQGHTTSEVCAALGVCHAWARRVKQERRELGKTKNSTTRRRTPRWMVYKVQIEEALARHWKTTTFLAGLRASGWVSPLVIDGALKGALFLNYVRQQLAPALKPGDILILDNLASHKVRGVREEIERVGAHVMHPPPYSPDLNPIELAFSKLRRLLRSLATRTVDALWQACGTVLQAFSPTEIRNYFRHAGYRYA